MDNCKVGCNRATILPVGNEEVCRAISAGAPGFKPMGHPTFLEHTAESHL